MDAQTECAVEGLDRKSWLEVEEAWVGMRAQGAELMPYFRRAYAHFRNAAGRAALIYYATRYARVSPDAFELGGCALGDRSKIVRDRACGLLAYSLRRDAVALLLELTNDPELAVRESVTAAISAINAQNHHLFVDRVGNGRVRWIVNEEDDKPANAVVARSLPPKRPFWRPW